MRDPAVLDPEIRAYLEAENAYMEAQLADTRALQEALFAEMKGAPQAGRQHRAGARRPLRLLLELRLRRPVSAPLPRVPRDGGAETVLLDGNVEAQGKPYWDLGAIAHSPDHKLLAYATDDKGSELFTIRIRDLATGQDLPDAHSRHARRDRLGQRRAHALLYSPRRPTSARSSSIGTQVGTPAEADELVYAEKDTGYYVGARQDAVGAVHPDRRPRPPVERDLPASTPTPRGLACGSGRGTRARPRVPGRAPRRAPDHHHQLGRRRGLPHLRGARSPHRAVRTGARSCRTSPAA